MPTTARPETIVADSMPDLKAALRVYIGDVLISALQYPAVVSMGVSGGSMPKLLAEVLPTIEGVNWKRVKIFMVDERVVPHGHADSNYGQWLAALPPALHPCLVPVEMVESVYKADRNAFPYDVSRTALQYESTLKQTIGPEIIGRLPRFDLVLLGIGPDGHTASIFPHSRLGKFQVDTFSWLVAVEDSPKPPPRRVTITMPVINQAKNIAFIITGEEKAPVVKAILERDTNLPASHVKPQYGNLKFFLDSASGSRLDLTTVTKAPPADAEVKMDVS